MTAVAACGLPLLASLAQVDGTAAAVGRGQAASAPLQFAVTSVSPAYAQNGATLTIKGRVRNVSGATASGLSVRLWYSTAPLSSRTAVENYAHGSYVPLGQSLVPGSPPVTHAQLPAGRGWVWTARIRVSRLGLGCFGVYPFTAVIGDSAAAQVASDPIPLPYWPAKPTRCGGHAGPRPFPISWIWPMIDTPHQAPCGGLVDNSLAAAIAPRGRLSNLLGVGARFASSANLTWAIDPALLDNVRTMTHPHLIGSSCRKRRSYPSSEQARAWLAAIVKATAGQPVFVTPYSDVDVEALTQYGDPDVNLAFSDGDLVAHQILGRKTIPQALPAGAWPASGAASSGTLEKLALNVSTVILTMPQNPAGRVTGSAVSSFLTGISRRLHILLADHGIAELLGSPDAGSRQAAAIFRVSQLYLAETAQIAAEMPGVVRPIVVTPPRRWNPAPRLAATLLADTAHAPWLVTSTAGQLVSMPARRSGLPPSQANRELSARLMHRIAGLDRQVSLLEAIRLRKDPQLYRAVFGIESSSWRGNRGKHAQDLLVRTARYVRSQLRGLSINASPYVTLGGKVGGAPVVIHNSLGYPVRVRIAVHATGANVTLARSQPVEVDAHSYSAAIKVTVRTTGSDQGVITMVITSPGGAVLPGTARTMHVKSTDFGTVALVICAAALAVFVAASAGRALRRGRGDQEATADGSPDPHSMTEYPGSVVSERPELSSTGPMVPERDRAAPGQHPTEEHR
jgi:hypothetical protein